MQQHDNPTFQHDERTAGTTTNGTAYFLAGTTEKGALDLANATPLKNGVKSEQPVRLSDLSGRKDPESAEYDPYDHREVEHPLTNFDALFHMMKASCGSGILAMPLAFMHAGYAVGLIGTAFIGFVCTYCVHILVQSEYAICKRRKIPSLAYHEIAREAFYEGPPIMKKLAKTAEFGIHASLAVYEVGACSVYTVFVAENLKQVVDEYGTELDVRLYMCMLLLPLIFVNWIRNLKYLAPFSTFAIVATIVAFGVVLSYVFQDLPPLSEREPVGQLANFPLFFGTVIFALEAIGVVIPLGNEMRTPAKFLGATGVLNRGMVPIVLLYIFLGFFGYIQYGENAAASITLNLPNSDVLAQAVKVLIALAIFGTHPLQCYVVVDIVWTTYLLPRFLKNPNVLKIEYAVRAGLVVLAFLFAVAIPDLGPFISLVGALSLSVVGILLPALIQLNTFWYHRHGPAFVWLVAKNAFLSAFALVGLLTGTYSSLLEIEKIYA